VQDLVDQAHGIDLAGRDGPAAPERHLGGETAGGGEIGQHGVAVQGEQGFVEAVFLSGCTGDVEFEFGHQDLARK
jgi:hypothetical protein